MKVRWIKPFSVIGLKVLTDVQTESDPEWARANRLWFDMYDQGRMFQIASKVNRTEYLTLFTDYGLSGPGSYTAIAGQRVVSIDRVPEGTEVFHFAGGEYLIFYARGDEVEDSNVLDRAYEKIARFFATSEDWARAYTTDFEVRGRAWNQVDIFVSIVRNE